MANVIATTLSKTKPSFTIARPNLGMPARMYNIIVTHHKDDIDISVLYDVSVCLPSLQRSTASDSHSTIFRLV